MRPQLVKSPVYKCEEHNLWEPVVLPAGESFMIGLDAGTAVSSDGSRLDGGQPRGRRGGGPGGGDPPQEAGVEAPPQALHVHTQKQRERERDKETKRQRQNCENRTRKTDFNQGS